MKGVDLRLFQFDYDQSWAVFFLNADGTIYGRYGTRGGDKKNAANYISIASFKKAIDRALQLHNAYPANKDQLAGKLGPDPPYAVAEKIPGLQDRAAGSTTPQNCIHCHMVGERVRNIRYKEQRLSPLDIWIYPLPANIGLILDVDDGLRVKKIIPHSPAALSGLQAGDELTAMNGQPLISQADVQWVLHRAPVETNLAIALRRGGQQVNKTIALSGNWKESDLSWRESTWSFRPAIWTVPLSDDERKKRNIPPGESVLLVKWVFGPAHLAKQAGLRDGDLIVAVDGKPVPADESHFMAYVRLHHPSGDKIKLTLLRGNDRSDVLMLVE